VESSSERPLVISRAGMRSVEMWPLWRFFWGIVLMLVTGHGCGGPGSDVRKPFAREVKRTCPSSADSEVFFPMGAFASSESDGEARRRKYASYLRDLREPSLFCGGGPEEAYRVLRLKPFHAEPLVVRIARMGADTRVVVVASTTAGADGHWIAVNRSEEALADRAWVDFERGVHESNFWYMPSYAVKMPGSPAILDGERFVVEGRSRGLYHVVGRGPEERPSSFGTLVERLLSLREGIGRPGA
jgi:hypothetical protein